MTAERYVNEHGLEGVEEVPMSAIMAMVEKKDPTALMRIFKANCTDTDHDASTADVVLSAAIDTGVMTEEEALLWGEHN